MSTTATDQLAAFVAGLRYEDLPPEVVSQAKRVILDAVGCIYGAYGEEKRKAAIASGLAARFPATGAARIIGGEATQPAMAAFGNGFLTNATDNDDPTSGRCCIRRRRWCPPPSPSCRSEGGRGATSSRRWSPATSSRSGWAWR